MSTTDVVYWVGIVSIVVGGLYALVLAIHVTEEADRIIEEIKKSKLEGK